MERASRRRQAADSNAVGFHSCSSTARSAGSNGTIAKSCAASRFCCATGIGGRLPPCSIRSRSRRNQSDCRFSVRGRIACDGERFDFTSTIRVGADGTFSFTSEGQSSGPLLTNRCGLVILHPADFAGLDLEIGHIDGSREATQFPRTISPGQPAFNIRSLDYTPGGGPRVLCRIDASLPSHQSAPCEMEDQRNWSDASFKTYVGSLLDPWPYLLQPDFQIRQRIEIVLTEIAAPSIKIFGRHKTEFWRRRRRADAADRSWLRRRTAALRCRRRAGARSVVAAGVGADRAAGRDAIRGQIG